VCEIVSERESAGASEMRGRAGAWTSTRAFHRYGTVALE
jgi:hypothetical protein